MSNDLLMPLIEVIDFLMPSLNLIQTLFFLLIFGISGVTVWSVKRFAIPDNWEHNWCNGTKDDQSDDLDAAHGSVHDISQAVATTPEKLADIMPGVLLVIGLLGTFLGLGMALNKASAILDVGSAVGGMDSTMMSNLTGMMQGLGTKFKTSTWGIAAFIALRAWASTNGYDERRLRWCVRKMKAEIDASRDKQLEREKMANEDLVKSIGQLGASICASLQKEITGNRDVLQRNEELLKDKREIARQTWEGIKTLTVLSKTQIEYQENAAENNLAMRKALEAFVEANSANIKSMQIAAKNMADSAEKMGDSADGLGVAIDKFQTSVTKVLDKVKTDLGTTIAEMNDSFQSNLKTISSSLVEATKGISTAVNELSINVERTMTEVKGSIGESLNIQRKAQAEFLAASETLQKNVEGMTILIERVCDDIQSGLKAVSESGRRLEAQNGLHKGIAEIAEGMVKEIQKLVEQISNDRLNKSGNGSK